MIVRTAPLGDLLLDIESGASPVCETRPPGPGEFGVLTLAAITGNRLLPEEAKALAAEAVDPKWPTLKAGSLLVTRASGSKGLVGACAAIATARPDRIVPDTAWQLVLNPASGVSQDWLFEFLRSGPGRRQILRAARGSSGIWKITKRVLKRLEIPLPSKGQAFALQGIARTLDGRMHLLDRLIQHKRAFKHALMQELLTGRRRFGEFGGEPWGDRPLGHFLREKTVRNGESAVQLVYSCSKLYGIIPQSSRFKHRVAAKNVTNYKIVEPGDLVFDPMLLWDASIGFVPPGAPGIVSPAYTTLSLTADSGSRAFLAHALFTHYARHMYRVASRGTNVRRKKVLASDFLRIRIPVPPTQQEQVRVAAVLDAADREIRALVRQRELLGALKRGLMQRLLSGDLDLSETLAAGTAVTTPDAGGNDDDS